MYMFTDKFHILSKLHWRFQEFTKGTHQRARILLRTSIPVQLCPCRQWCSNGSAPQWRRWNHRFCGLKRRRVEPGRQDRRRHSRTSLRAPKSSIRKEYCFRSLLTWIIMHVLKYIVTITWIQQQYFYDMLQSIDLNLWLSLYMLTVGLNERTVQR